MSHERAESNRERALLGLPPLLSLEEFQQLRPKTRGFVSYMQANWPGSGLPKDCPDTYSPEDRKAWELGAYDAMLEAQEMED